MTYRQAVTTGPRAPIQELLRNRDFGTLLATRMTGSLGDGLLQAGLASFVLFSPERQATPLAVATSFGILLLPYSLIGPFAGVFLDRWRRRQVLVRANWLRAATTLLVLAAILAGQVGGLLAIVVLVTLGTGRFVLSGLSAALPHVVTAPQLVTANAFAPTAGTVVYGLGALVGISLRGLTGGGDAGSQWVLVAAAVTYLVAGLFPLAFRRDQLGPTGDRPGESVADVLRGLIDGARALVRNRPSRQAVLVIWCHRLAYGALTILLLLLLRNTLNPPSDPDAALRGFSVVAAGVTGGALLAAFITPTLTRRLGTVTWTSLGLGLAAVASWVFLPPATLASLTAAGVVLGMASQVAKIGADTTVQRTIGDDHLGRVFSLYDMGVNVALVLGAITAAVFAPISGVTVPGFVGFGVAYLALGLWYLGTRPRTR